MLTPSSNRAHVACGACSHARIDLAPISASLDHTIPSKIFEPVHDRCSKSPAERSDLSSLSDIWKRIDRSNSWGYNNGLVPKFDKTGEKIESKKSPPWPWVSLPDPVIKVGKKQWLSASIDQWFFCMAERVACSKAASDLGGGAVQEKLP